MDMMQYLTNPLGKGSSVLMLSSAKKELEKQYTNLRSLMSVRWYSLDKKYLVAHVKVPSHSVEDLFYDVLIQIDSDTVPDNVAIINSGNAKVFSNCPSFVFTYAKTFKTANELIEWTTGKYDKAILKKEPIQRNPANVISYERSLYLAIKYILSNGRNYKSKVNLSIINAKNTKQILKEIPSFKEKMEEYEEKRKKVETAEKKIDMKKETSQSMKLPPKKTGNGIKSVGGVKKVNKTKKTSKIKRI